MTTVRELLLQNPELHILPYKIGSQGAKNLRDAMQPHVPRKLWLLRPETAAKKAMYLNWGAGSVAGTGASLLNSREAIKTCVDKPTFLRAAARSGAVPASTTSADEAVGWLQAGMTVVARHRTQSFEGRGVQIISPNGELHRAEDLTPGESWLNAKLFTGYVPKTQEYRVFVARINGMQAFLVRRKGKAKNQDGRSYSEFVRSWKNGWNFCKTEPGEVPKAVTSAAINAASCVRGLNFGAVDVGFDERSGRACVYEINTAPGLEGETVQLVADAILSTHVL